MFKKTIITAVCASLIAVALVGCGKKDEIPEDFLKETPLVTTTESAGASAAGAQTESTPEADAEISPEASAPAETAPADQAEESPEQYEVYAGITRLEAIEYVTLNAGSGGKITDVSKGTDEAGNPAWVITVAPVTTAEGPETITFHVSDANSFFGDGKGDD